MRQRVMIAMALACRPRLMLADEPTTALDVTIQAQILELIARLKEEMNTSVMLITHDLGVVAQSVQKVAVMYAGEVVEHADVKDLFSTPLHPYTVGLLESIPIAGPDTDAGGTGSIRSRASSPSSTGRLRAAAFRNDARAPWISAGSASPI